MPRILPILFAISTALLLACSGADTLEDRPVADGQRLTVPIGDVNQATVIPPKGTKRLDLQTWVQQLGQDRLLLYRVHRAAAPEGGLQSAVDAALAELGKQGQGGVERDSTLQLGDLDARHIRATDLKASPPTSLWMVATEAEDGIYTALVLGQLDDVRKFEQQNMDFLTSLRILNAQGAPASRPQPADDLAPPDAPTPTGR
ncbi:MAG: hypothetical protein HY902_20805 [Deltaproteobacteria bacterium]|nr:hypothetical protein [Deltaproteobacteria bacterium]